MREILSAYRTAGSAREIAQLVSEYLKNIMHCEAVSFFEFSEVSQNLSLFYTTSQKVDKVINVFGNGTFINMIFRQNKDLIVNYEMIKENYPTADIFFEDSSKAYSLAFARVIDCHNRPIGIIRTLNKIGNNGKIVDFNTKDLNTLIDAANILGAGLVALNAHQRAMAFLDSVTHELRAPMSGARNAAKFLLGYISYKSEESEEDSKQRILMNLQDIVRSAEASISLVDGITMFSRSGRMSERDLEKQPTRLFKDVITKSISNVSPLIAFRGFDRGKIRVVNYQKWPVIKVDQKIMEQVFSNLLTNSIKYAHDDKDSFSIDIIMEELPDGSLIISIKDYGIGIDADDAKKIFLSGERGKRAREKVPTGMGIGLTMVNKMLLLHGMSIELHSLSLPTEFYIKIPSNLVIRSTR